MATYLTPHFTLEEFIASQTASRMGIPNVPPCGSWTEDSAERNNLVRTAEVMEEVRVLLGNKPVLISSGYRCQAVNEACGGSSTSAHMSGLAVDFTCPGFGTPLEICNALSQHLYELEVDQLIHEYEGWVHLGLSGSEARCMCLTINNYGTQFGFV